MRQGKIHIGEMFCRQVTAQYCKYADPQSLINEDLLFKILREMPSFKKYICKRCLHWFYKDYEKKQMEKLKQSIGSP